MQIPRFRDGGRSRWIVRYPQEMNRPSNRLGDRRDGTRASPDDMIIAENSTSPMHTIFVDAGNDRSKV